MLLASAGMDRLTHGAHIVVITDASYRAQGPRPEEEEVPTEPSHPLKNHPGVKDNPGMVAFFQPSPRIEPAASHPANRLVSQQADGFRQQGRIAIEYGTLLKGTCPSSSTRPTPEKSFAQGSSTCLLSA